MHKPIDPTIKVTILEEVKNGVSVKEAAVKYGVTNKAIYNWLRAQSDNTGTSNLEIAKLRRENQELKEIIGMFALDKKRAEKNTKSA
jgi:transposase-like protein